MPADTVRKIRVLPSDPGTASALSVSRESGDRRVNRWEEQGVLYRQEYALPIWLQFHAWLLAQKDQVLPKSPLGEALGVPKPAHQIQVVTHRQQTT
jgi:hypothetical protein